MACRRSALARHGPFREVNLPLWEWLIRAAQAGVEIRVTHRQTPEGNSGFGPGSDLGPATELLPALVPSRPGREQDWLLADLRQFCASNQFLPDAAETIALQAGLFQWHDYLAESHEQSQRIEGAGPDRLGDYWHAIMHRREPDYSNARYWFRHVGPQAMFSDLARIAGQILSEPSADPETARWHARLLPHGRWDPAAFVDLCEACEHRSSKQLMLAAQRIQQAEMALLMHATFRHALRGEAPQRRAR